jgi:hypothetical protein
MGFLKQRPGKDPDNKDQKESFKTKKQKASRRTKGYY